MKDFFIKFSIFNSITLCLLAYKLPVKGQIPIAPDDTTSTNVNQTGKVFEITGGLKAGGNLFHSFQKFSVPTGNEAFFNNIDTIDNIISRVTGGNISSIDGLIRANSANLFLINPKGIIFGRNASLNIGGSFLGSTAESILFPEGEFSATDTQSNPLLTINAPIGLSFSDNPGMVTNRSQASNGAVNALNTPVGLQVSPGKTLSLVGGQINLENGNLTAPGGRIEIGSVADNSIVSITPAERGFTLGYEAVSSFQDIQLAQFSLIDTTDLSGTINGGFIDLQGKSLTLSDASQIFSFNLGTDKGNSLTINTSESVDLNGAGTLILTQPSGTGSAGDVNIETRRLTLEGGATIASVPGSSGGESGNLTIKATELVELVGTTPDRSAVSTIGIAVFPGRKGNAKDLIIETERLVIRDGAQVLASTFGEGNAGNLIVKATESVELIGTVLGTNLPSGLLAQVEQGATGKGGNLTVETKQLTVLDGAQISTAARNSGEGGNLTINASDSILLSGTGAIAALDLGGRSGLFVSAEPGAINNAGDLLVNTELLTVEKGAIISADNFGTGEGGDISLNIDRLIARSGGQIGAGSLTSDNPANIQRGSGGTLIVNASDSIEVIGTGNVGNDFVRSSIFTKAQGNGDAGNLIINTPNLTVSNGGEITAQSAGTGKGGDITFTGEGLTLNNGFITASTASTQGGNITLKIDNNLQFVNDGEITATAGTAQAGGDGGNVKIDSDFILAFPTDNTYQITANAFTGKGGEIDITTNSIFGREFINISASSQFGLDGNIAIDTPDVDPVQGSINLPIDVIDPSQLVSQRCLAGDEEKEAKSSEFIVTGRGGLPPSPNQSLKGDATISPEWVAIDSLGAENNENNNLEAKRTNNRPKLPEIIQARGWVRDANGRLALVAENPHGVSSSSLDYPQCQNLSQQ